MLTSVAVSTVLGMPPSQQSPAQSAPDVPELRSLGPQFDETLHGRHAEVLVKVLTDESAGASKNIALAGHYGSGKSSVILGVQRGLDAKKVKWVNLSLSSLGIDGTRRGRIHDDGTLAPLTNLIQKEIVKQLLYRKAPKDMPGSRYFRIDSFRAGRAAQWAVAAALGVFTVAVLLGLVGRVKQVAPIWISDGPTWGPWLAVGLLSTFAGVVCFMALRSLQNPVKVDSVSAGGATVSLSAKENSYFDEYLDEIVYFFQRTNTQVAIFEDLDRFKDPHIFETLRELNTVLNNSEQVESRPVRFVYAVRDSIFEQLEVDPGELGDNGRRDDERPSAGGSTTSARATPGSSSAPVLRASAQESAPSANRTKFFDLVVPMVPFLTHRSARDLLTEEFEASHLKPSAAALNLVGGDRALTDMRLIRNIRNEFEMYRASVLSDKGLQGLTADRLFAMMVYKNTHLEDFEAIRLGTSQIDAAHRAFRQMVEHQATYQAGRSRTALNSVRAAASWDRRARVAGERLQQTLPIVHLANRQAGAGEPQVITSAGTVPMNDLTSGNFWRRLHQTQESVQVGGGYYTTTVTFEQLLLLAGEAGMSMKHAVDADVSELKRVSQQALETKEFVSTATMAQVMARTDLTMPAEGGDERNLDTIISELVSPMARNLLAKGLIDENYTLYCSDYQGVAISVSTMNFILHCVQVDEADPLFRFDSPESIDAVETEVGDRFLGGESVFNVDVFNHYLTKNSSRLQDAFDRLVVLASSGHTTFIDLFLGDETPETAETKHRFVKELAPRWSSVLVYLIEAAAPEQRAGFVDEAMRAASNELTYQSSDELVKFVEQNYGHMSAFIDDLDDEHAADLVMLLRELEMTVGDLATLGDAQRRAAVTAALYPITRSNLLTALGADTREDDRHAVDVPSLSLDVLKARDEVIYQHACNNLDDYLKALRRKEVSIEDPEAFLDVLGDLARAPERLVHSVVERAAESCCVADLAELDQALWKPVVSADRLVLSVSNVSRYADVHGITSDLAERLVAHDLVGVEDADDETKLELAYALVDAENMESRDQVRAVGQLSLTDYLEPSDFSKKGLELIPQLLAANEVPDTEETYSLIAERPYPLREDYFAASKKLKSYVTSLPLSSDDLAQMMKSRRVPQDVKLAIASTPDFVAVRLSTKAVIAICEWADRGSGVSAELLLVLTEAGAPAARVLTLLEPLLTSIDMDTLDSILRALGEEYELLAQRGHQRPRLKPRPGTEPLLEELQTRDRVSSFKQVPIVNRFHVNMRR